MKDNLERRINNIIVFKDTQKPIFDSKRVGRNYWAFKVTLDEE